MRGAASSVERKVAEAMGSPAIGVDLDDLRLPVKEGLVRAAESGFQLLELPTTQGETAPRNLTSSGRRHLARHVDGLGLKLAALTVEIPGLRLTDPRTVDERVERTCETIELARELGVSIVTAATSALTHPDTGVPDDLAMAALHRIGEYADSRGVVYAIRPSQDRREGVVRVLQALGCRHIQLAVDPAALVMNGADPVALLESLGDQLSLVHARDATAGRTDHPGQETRFGDGEVDLVGLFKLLRTSEFSGPIVARRQETASPFIDLVATRDAVRRLL